jgi:hypothetical protein
MGRRRKAALRLAKKDYVRAQAIVQFFADKKVSYTKAAAMVFPFEDRSTMLSVFTGERWTDQDLDRWDQVIAALQ